ncbi:MAG: poly(R)-hydroxyalkanoic acid synthase subunit PhaE [Dokdonella sp.]|uniref:poly(R)-hydroxyalkanoic acid synthase subunit PhaE n=2 Tax=Dokdonella sp. TaxID=2291710 RepID=UPI003BB0DD1F
MSELLDVGQWAKNWEAMARQAQSAMSGNPGVPAWGSAPTPTSTWIENMTQANPFVGGKQQSEAIEHLLAGAQGYLGMLQSLANGATGQGSNPLANAFAGSGFTGAFPASAMGNPFAAALRSFGTLGASGFDQMMEQFAAAAGPMFDKAKGALQMPAFGHLREKQENLQKTAQVFIDYQEQSARYDRLMLKVGEHSIARFQLKLAEREEPGRQVDSARGLYDLWVDAAEEAYAEIALSEEFREIYAAVVDAQMRVRQQVQGEIERICNQLGMPTRSEVNSIGERLQALRREFRAEREAANGSEALHGEVAELRREIAALNSAREGRPKRQAASTRVAAEKTAKTAKPVPPGRRLKAKKSAKPGKPAKATVALRALVEPQARSVASKPAAALESKATPGHREKRRKSAAGKAQRKAVAITQSRAAKGKKTATSGSFAASIARFARKSKTTSVAAQGTGAKSKASKQGGSK